MQRHCAWNQRWQVESDLPSLPLVVAAASEAEPAVCAAQIGMRGWVESEERKGAPTRAQMVVQMVAIGEEAGALDKMLFKVAEFYEQEVNNAVDALSSLLEPFIMVIIGVLVGGMVIGMYLPIFKLAAVVG